MAPLALVSGLPFHLSGWNTYFKRINENQYYCESYLMYYIYPIQGAYIEKVNDKWKLRRSDWNFHFDYEFYFQPAPTSDQSQYFDRFIVKPTFDD